MPRQDLDRPRDDLLQAAPQTGKTRGLVRPGQNDRRGATKRSPGSPQAPPRQEPAPPEGIGRVYQHEIHVPVQLPVLKAIVEQQDVQPEAPQGRPPRPEPASP